MAAFERELADLLNKHAFDAACGVPDFILCSQVIGLLESIRRAEILKRQWNGTSQNEDNI
jgi:hypothetical protein